MNHRFPLELFISTALTFIWTFLWWIAGNSSILSVEFLAFLAWHQGIMLMFCTTPALSQGWGIIRVYWLFCLAWMCGIPFFRLEVWISAYLLLILPIFGIGCRQFVQLAWSDVDPRTGF